MNDILIGRIQSQSQNEPNETVRRALHIFNQQHLESQLNTILAQNFGIKTDLKSEPKEEDNFQ